MRSELSRPFTRTATDQRKSSPQFPRRLMVLALMMFVVLTSATLQSMTAEEPIELIPPPPEDEEPELLVGEPSPETGGATPGASSSTSGDGLLSIALPTVGGAWVPQGPGPILNGQVENIIPNNEVIGAIHAVAAHPTDPDIIYIGAVNGGIWRTRDATATSPTWTPLTDGLSSLSIGAIEFDPTDPTHQTLIAGVGLFSSFGRRGGGRTGLMRTTDGGDTWSEIDGGGALIGKNISGVAARGDTIVVSVNFADFFSFGNIGIFRSIDDGLSFVHISQGTGSITGLPGGLSHDLAGDLTSLSTLYTDVVFANLIGGRNGIYKSIDTGATWTKVSDAAMDSLIISSSTSNIEMSVGRTGQIYVGILNFGQLAGLFRSGDAGATWAQMDTPTTNEKGVDIGINPGTKPSAPGGQGSIHFSILADPDDPNIVYLGGDRQPYANEGTGGPVTFPNSIGADDFSGRLFRCDSSKPPGNQCVHLTHSDQLGAEGGGTANHTAPHADSRDMVFDVNGDIIEGDDGGIYRRTSPEDNSGDWFSINGSLQVTEFHDIVYDSVSNIVIGGAQDTGTSNQIAPGATTWDSVSTADGGDVAVDDMSEPGFSTRYSSFQFLFGFRRRVYDSGNNLISEAFPALAVKRGGNPLVPQFVTPVEVNAVDGDRLAFGGSNSVYESFNRGNTIIQLAPPFISVNRNAMAYGGRAGGVDNPDVIYVGSGSRVFIRIERNGQFLRSFTYPGGFVSDVVLDSNDYRSAYVIDNDQVFWTTDAGASWTEVTGNLTDVDLRTIAFASNTNLLTPASDVVVVGGRRGVFLMHADDPGVWFELGAGLPEALVFDLSYDAADDVLVAGTLGRGAWLQRGDTPPPPTIHVEIDVQPGSFPNVIKLGDSSASIPVAILTTETFDSSTADPLSIRFGPGGATEIHQRGHTKDVDRDRDRDLVLHFAVVDSGIQCGDITVSLTGKTFDEVPIEGSDSIVVICD